LYRKEHALLPDIIECRLVKMRKLRQRSLFADEVPVIDEPVCKALWFHNIPQIIHHILPKVALLAEYDTTFDCMFAFAIIEVIISPAMLVAYSLGQRFATRVRKPKRQRRYIYQ
jgi:hypothetical protein